MPRFLFVLLTVVSIALLLAACAADSPVPASTDAAGEGEDAAPAATAEPSATPEPPTEVTLCAIERPATLYEDSPAAVAIRDLIGGRVATFGVDFEAEPGILAELPQPGTDSLTVNEDGSVTVTLHYRDDLAWADGEPFSADDARLGLLLPSGVYDPRFEVLEASVVDPLTLRVTAAIGVEYPYVPSQIPLPAHLIDEGSAAGAGGDWLSTENPALTVTLGPYLLTEAGEEAATFTPNPVYPAAGESIDRVHVAFVGDATALIAGLADGSCDVALDGTLAGQSLADLAAASGDGGWTLAARSGFVSEQVWFNSYTAGLGREPYFADTRVRQAVGYAVDRPALSAELFGEALPTLDSWIPPGHWATLQGIEPAYALDAGQASALLDEAGWRDEDGDGVREYHGEGGDYTCGRGGWSIAEGTPLAPVLVIPAGDAERAAEADRLVSDLAAVGFGLTVQEQDPATLYSADGALVQRQFDMALLAGLGRPDPRGISRWGGAAIYLDPISGEAVTVSGLPDFGAGTEFIVERLMADNTPGIANDFTGQNYGGWCDEAANLAIAQADGLRPLADRAAAYGAHQLRFAADLPALPLYVRPLVGGVTARVCGVQPGPYDALTWNIAAWRIDETGACEG